MVMGSIPVRHSKVLPSKKAIHFFTWDDILIPRFCLQCIGQLGTVVEVQNNEVVIKYDGEETFAFPAGVVSADKVRKEFFRI